jgi:hypothetical protein
MPVPTGFSRQMPIKPRVNFLAKAFCVKFSRGAREIHAPNSLAGQNLIYSGARIANTGRPYG